MCFHSSSAAVVFITGRFFEERINSLRSVDPSILKHKQFTLKSVLFFSYSGIIHPNLNYRLLILEMGNLLLEGTNFRESLNIQNRDIPSLGPSPKNSCPRPLLHFPQRT